MFGYVKTYTPELKVRENEYYKAVYCGLCRAMGKCTGQCSRMTLSYDFAFLACLRIALTGNTPKVSHGRCIAHTLKKKPYMTDCRELDFCAYSSAILGYHKCLDNVNDERGMKKFKSSLALPSFKRMRKKALKAGYSSLDETISEKLTELSETETRHLCSVDVPASIFGNICSEILSYGMSDESLKISREIGYRLGKWIYIIDAVDDYEEDLKKHRFNPFICLCGDTGLDDTMRENVENALKVEISYMISALDLIELSDMRDIREILYNIAVLGLEDTAHKVIHKSQLRGKK